MHENLEMRDFLKNYPMIKIVLLDPRNIFSDGMEILQTLCEVAR